VNNRVAGATWRSRGRPLVATWGQRVGSTRKQPRRSAQAGGVPALHSRITTHHKGFARGRRAAPPPVHKIGSRDRDRRASAICRPQKLTRPDGEIRAGRVDRRRGSGGRERRSGL
jgi:hypothetical protein